MRSKTCQRSWRDALILLAAPAWTEFQPRSTELYISSTTDSKVRRS